MRALPQKENLSSQQTTNNKSSEIEQLKKQLFEANSINANLKIQLQTKDVQMAEQRAQINKLNGENRELRLRMRELRSAHPKKQAVTPNNRNNYP